MSISLQMEGGLISLHGPVHATLSTQHMICVIVGITSVEVSKRKAVEVHGHYEEMRLYISCDTCMTSLAEQ